MSETPKPRLLAVDNFTPQARTPWGGRRIASHYKRAELGLRGDEAAPCVGESWELSVEPDFPSRTDDGETLASLFARDPGGYLGEAEARLGSTRLLVKLLDAAEPLSVQIHPADDSPGLSPEESGKPESWYVLERMEGAGLYVGLREGVTEAGFGAAIEGGEDVSALLHFVEVEPGDFFSIEAGTPHAIGAGVTLVEPQRVLPGRRGLTYRYWDWNRRYGPDGAPSPAGEPRALHLQEALAVTAWDAPREGALLERIRHRAGAPPLEGPAKLERLGGPLGPVVTPHLAVERLMGRGQMTLMPEPRLRALTVVEGKVRLEGHGFALDIPRGRTAALPAAMGVALATLDRAHAVISSVP
jgi:mannose-6-phosphate isomerase